MEVFSMCVECRLVGKFFSTICAYFFFIFFIVPFCSISGLFSFEMSFRKYRTCTAYQLKPLQLQHFESIPVDRRFHVDGSSKSGILPNANSFRAILPINQRTLSKNMWLCRRNQHFNLINEQQRPMKQRIEKKRPHKLIFCKINMPMNPWMIKNLLKLP